jgi:hypothetical protein
VKIYVGTGTSGVRLPVIEVPVAEDGSWEVVAPRLKRRKTYTVQAEQSDAAGNTDTSNTSTFKIKK